MGGQKHAKFRAIFYHFRLWSRISPEQDTISKIGKTHDLERFFPRSTKKVRRTLVHYLQRNPCEFRPTKMDFLGRLYFGPQRVLPIQIFTRARDWPRLPSAHPNWDGGPPPKKRKIQSWKFKIWPKSQRMSHNNFGSSVSILTKLFQSTCRRAGVIMWVPFSEGPPPKIWEGKKIRPKFGAISDNFRLWSRLSSERIATSKSKKNHHQLHTTTPSTLDQKNLVNFGPQTIEL